MPTSPSTRLALVGPNGSVDLLSSGDDMVNALITQLEAVGAGYKIGTSRPSASAALAGYVYINTSSGQISFCTGSSWIDVQAHDSDLDSIAALTTATFGRSLLTLVDGIALRALLPVPRSKVKRVAASQSIANNTLTPVTFPTLDYDVGIGTTAGANRIAVPSGDDGLYTASGGVSWNPNGTGTRYMKLTKNGTPFAFVEQGPNPTAGVSQLASCDLVLTAGDYVDLQVLQTSGGALNVSDAHLSLRQIA